MITGIQQVGIGVTDAARAKYYYRDAFGMDVKVFDDKAPASLMTRYTGNKVQHRHAILALNLAGGGGFEIWQYTSRPPASPAQELHPGDPGIFAVRIKSANIQAAHAYFSSISSDALSAIFHSPEQRAHFWVKDIFGNWFNVVESEDWFKMKNTHCGGVTGAVIGVTDMEKAIRFYADLLGLQEEVYNTKTEVNDLPGEPGIAYHRVLLRKRNEHKGPFSKLFGDMEIELVQALDKAAPTPIFQGRYWGDCGFIHLCFDVIGMDALKKKAIAAGHAFTVDSEDSFAMEKAAGRFAYLEDPDGTLIELVETHKIPIIKKIGWYMDLRKRRQPSPLPDWMIACLGLSKIK